MTTKNSSFAQGKWTELAIGDEEALARLPGALKNEGFGIITEIYEKDDGKVVLGAIDPMQTLGATADDAGLADLAREVGARLERALATLSS
jgi:uncharacterized protein (DUF302 family)